MGLVNSASECDESTLNGGGGVNGCDPQYGCLTMDSTYGSTAYSLKCITTDFDPTNGVNISSSPG